MHEVGVVAPTTDANRVTYRAGVVRAWYANGPMGIEQGFDVFRAPAIGSGRLILSMALAGTAGEGRCRWGVIQWRRRHAPLWRARRR
jgi:hypothetical protein